MKVFRRSALQNGEIVMTTASAATTASLVLLDWMIAAPPTYRRVTFNNPEKRNAPGVAGKERFIEVMTASSMTRACARW
jgi:hypothetical protein